jgi:hypothetical protein
MWQCRLLLLMMKSDREGVLASLRSSMQWKQIGSMVMPGEYVRQYLPAYYLQRRRVIQEAAGRALGRARGGVRGGVKGCMCVCVCVLGGGVGGGGCVYCVDQMRSLLSLLRIPAPLFSPDVHAATRSALSRFVRKFACIALTPSTHWRVVPTPSRTLAALSVCSGVRAWDVL